MDKDLRIKELEKLIRHHNELYFQKNAPEISDYDFDKLVEELKRLKPNSPVLYEITSDFKEGKKVTHSSFMLSLDKCYDDNALKKWKENFTGDVVVSPKVDGMAISLKYDENGKLNVAATRGNGIVGEEITRNVYEIKDIPRQISLKNVEVRGEIYMRLSVFKKYEKQFANPRNLAAGAVKQKDPAKTREYQLSFFAYDVLNKGFKTEDEKYRVLKSLGFPILDYKIYSDPELSDGYKYFLERREGFDFETDGVVYKANLVSEQISLGATEHHPKFAIAYKYQGDSGVTKLIAVEWSVSRSGLITPIGIVEPIELSGALVRRATLHNLGWLRNMNASIGAEVLMMRRGGVIPHLEEVLKGTDKSIAIPNRCPSCGGEVEEEDDFLYCKKPKNCVMSKVGELIHFIQTIGCDGFGDKMVERLYAEGIVIEPDDFFKLKVEDLIDIERMGKKLATKLIANIDSKRRLKLDVFLRALGIRELGKNLARLFLRFRTLDRIRKVKVEELAQIYGVGELTANIVIEGLRKKAHLIENLLKEIELEEDLGSIEGKFTGKVFLFTGGLVSMPREDAIRKVEENGGRISSGVTADLNFLVIGDKGGVGSKLDKANKLKDKGSKLEIISESDFLKMLNGD